MKWLTANELAGLPGMPNCSKRTREKLTRMGIPSRPRAGRVGGGLEYDGSALPEETRAAIAAKQISTAGSVALAAIDVPAVPSFVSTTVEHVPTVARIPSQSEKDVADARVRLVNMVHELVHMHGLRNACQLLAARITTGAAGTEAQSIARKANQRARGDTVSARTLERWVGMHRANGWWGLLPVQETARDLHLVNDDVAAVLGLYQSRDPRFRKLTGAAKEVTRKLGRDFDSWRTLYHRSRRALDKLGKSAKASVALIKARHTGSERDVLLPYKKRDASMLAPLDVFVMDGHTFKAKVRHPDHGAPFAPELTMVLDWSTRMLVGWSASLSENVIAVGDALRHAIGQWGIPAIVYTDNGAGETARIMDCPIDGLMARLGIDHRTGIPGKPQGRGVIERSWQTHAINCARQFGSYQGSDVDGGTYRKVAAELASEQRAIRRAEATGAVVKLNSKAPTWAQFVDAIEVMVREYNTEHRHRALPKREDGKHMTPAEAWAAKFDPSLQHKPTLGELRELFMPAVLRTAKRGQVTLFNQDYQAAELMRRDVDGREVSVRYDIHDPHFVRVYTVDGDFVCDALWNANRIDAMPKPVVQIARERRVATTIKRREQQIETALRELDAPIDVAGTFALPAPAAPVVKLPLVAEVTEPDAIPAATSRPFFDAPSDRYEWLMRNRTEWTAADGTWLRNYVASDDYADLRDYYDGRGMGWNDTGEQPGLKSAL